MRSAKEGPAEKRRETTTIRKVLRSGKSKKRAPDGFESFLPSSCQPETDGAVWMAEGKNVYKNK